jgi:hypothetical protein
LIGSGKNADMSVKNLIPNKTLAKVKLRIRSGGYDETSQGWTDGYATRSPSGSIYLNVEFTVLGGEYSGRKVFSTIGLRSQNGSWWGTKGRLFMRDIVNSAHGIQSDDISSKAVKARELQSLGELNGLEFVACIKKSKNRDGKFENVIDEAVKVVASSPSTQTNKLRRKDITSITKSRKIVPAWVE